MQKTNDKSQTFQSSVGIISRVFCDYSIEDVAASLFVSYMWVRNIASPIQHQFLTMLLASLKPNQFKNEKRVRTYNEFKAFLEEVYESLPSFRELEDYVPEPDWGDVKFHHGEANYRVFYGCEISNIYDWLMLFQMIYASLDKEYSQQSKRSPASELRQCLGLQNDIITSIAHQACGERLNDLSPGHIEIPPEDFWAEACRFYSNYRPEGKVEKSFLETYSTDLGAADPSSVSRNKFCEGAFSGSVLPFFFIRYGERFFPILPRRYLPILLDSWSPIFASCYKRIGDHNFYSLHLNSEICFFLTKRMDRKYFFPMVSPVDGKGKPHEPLFGASFISKDRLILIHVLPPFCTAGDAEKKLEEIASKLNQAVGMIAGPPVRLGLNIERKTVQFEARSDGTVLKPVVFVVLAQASTQVEPVEIPESLRSVIIVSLDQFLAIMDEIDKRDEVAGFLDYLGEINEATHFPLISLLDKYASFKQSSGVLIAGARTPDLIMLDPHWGSNFRYESLARFWRLYLPSGFFDHPRSWKVEQETATRVRLTARGYFGCALYFQIGGCSFFTNAPFDRITFEQCQIANLLMESIEDSMSANKTVIEKHRFFSAYSRSQVTFFPQTLVVANEDFKHLKHLNPLNSLWCSDTGFVEPGLPGVRVVFDDQLVLDAFQKTRDRTIEIDLLLEVLTRLDMFLPDPLLSDISKDLNEQKLCKPRFKLFKVRKEVSFPEFVPEYSPSIHHHKRARKRLAEIASGLGLKPGTYQLDQAKAELNSLRRRVVQEVEGAISEYNYTQAIPYLIERIDALNHNHEDENLSLAQSLEHEVDFDRERAFTTEHKDYSEQGKNFRYLIEKFVQLEPRGKTTLDKDGFQYLAALVDKLHEIYMTSDAIHYDIAPVGMHVDDDYVIGVRHEQGFEKKQEEYAKEQASISLGLVGNKDDRVDLQKPVETYLDALDDAFRKDLGFGAKNMINLLQILSQWPCFRDTVKENSYYAATEEEIRDACSKNIKGIDSSEMERIIQFLTLRSEEVIQVIDENGKCTDCEDLPVWEHRKRYARYNLRPLIEIGDNYYWGPYSARKSGIIWSNVVAAQSLPADIRGSTIMNVVRAAKKDIEDALVTKTFEIAKRRTPYVEGNARLHDRDKKGNHPKELGDYDVLAFWPEKNLVLNIEDKDILPAFCLKDAKGVRDKIFGPQGKNEGYLRRVERRMAYLSEHLSAIGKIFGWRLDYQTGVVSVFVSRHSYWWTKFPPRPTKVHFVRIDLLGKLLDNL